MRADGLSEMSADEGCGRRLFTDGAVGAREAWDGVEIGLPQRLANAGYKGTLPATFITARGFLVL